MLTTPLTHPELLFELGRAGHGSQVLVADGNYPFATGRRPGTRVVYLNLRPGLVSVTDVLVPLLATVPLEAAAVMAAPDGSAVPAHQEYARLVAPVEVAVQERFAFYESARSQDVALVVATGDERQCANLLLTIGVRTAG